MTGPIEISGYHPAVQSALSAVASTPQFAQLVAQHAAAMQHSGQAGPSGLPPLFSLGNTLAQNGGGGYTLAQNGGGYNPGCGSVPTPTQPSSTGGPGVPYGGTPTIQARDMRDIRGLAIGFYQPGILPSSIFNVISRPQVIFRPERLVIPDSLAYPGQTGGSTQADSFQILDLKTGNRSMLVEATSLPARAFVEQAVGTRMSFDTAVIAQDLVIQVQNVDVAAATFRAVMFGTAAY